MAAGKPPVVLTIDQRSLIAVRKALAAETDGKALRKEFIKELRTAAQPAVPELQASVRRLPDVNPAIAEPRLRDAVARQIKVAVRLGGKTPGVALRVGTNKDPRGFRFAGRRLNNPKGWRHPVYGNTDAYVQQYGRRGVRWFEPVALERRDEYADAVRKALESMARRIADRTTRGQR